MKSGQSRLTKIEANAAMLLLSIAITAKEVKTPR